MNIRKLVYASVLGVAACGITGCWTSSANESSSPAPMENISVTLASGQTLPGAIMKAASKRRWLPQAQADGSIRCTLSQREHLVVVDVVPMGGESFSIRPVQSNIPVRKYDQWVNNLSREIVYQASR